MQFFVSPSGLFADTRADPLRNGGGTGADRVRNGCGMGAERVRNGCGTPAERRRIAGGTPADLRRRALWKTRPTIMERAVEGKASRGECGFPAEAGGGATPLDPEREFPVLVS